LRREIERHIARRLFSASTVDFVRAGVNADGEMAPQTAFSLRRGLGHRGQGSTGRLRAVRVLIVDDHPIIISGCRSLLEGEPDIEVIEAQDGAAGFAAFFAERPDIGVIDINLPGYSGLELLRRILEREPEARLVIFSMNDDPTVAARAIEAGAKGYIAKNDDPTLFAGAIKTVANGGRYLHPEMARRIAFLRADPSPDALSNLSPRELEILRLLAAGRTMAQIADLLNVSYKTIANNCTQLKQKLGARSAMDLMRIAIDARS
jgi:two-component system, NarL family, invasion response regulator UvrY